MIIEDEHGLKLLNKLRKAQVQLETLIAVLSLDINADKAVSILQDISDTVDYAVTYLKEEVCGYDEDEDEYDCEDDD